MNSKLSEVPLNPTGKVKSLLYIIFSIIDILHFFKLWQGIIDQASESNFIRNHIRNLIGPLKRYSNRSSRVLKCRFCCNLHKRSDWANLFLSIFLWTIVNYSLSLRILKVDIKVGHWYSRWIQKSLKEEIKWKRINIRNFDRSSKERPGTRTSSWTYYDHLFFRSPHIVWYDQKVGIKPHFFDHFKLVFKSINILS